MVSQGGKKVGRPESRQRAAALRQVRQDKTSGSSDTSMSLSDSNAGRTNISDTGVSLNVGGSDSVEYRVVDVDELRPNRLQPRSGLGDSGIEELARSVAVNGVVQPIIVRESEDGLEIIAGERRWRAARKAGLGSVPVVVREATDEEMLELALVENIHREDLNAVDRASAYRMYCDEFDMTAEAVAERLGEDRTTVTNYLRLLELPELVQEMVAGSEISMGHARSLLGLVDDVRRLELAQRVVEKGMSVRMLESLVRRERPRRATVSRRARRAVMGVSEANLREIERKFEDVLGTKVRIRLGPSRKNGRIVVEFFSLDEFEGICRKVGVLQSKKGETGE